jgi:phytoene dehydrogenase-like protein
MLKDTQKVVIIGGGIAGLCAAVYAQRCGYQAEVLEMHDNAGGLATHWRRGGYTFETCLHWLLGSNPNGAMHSQWAEVCDIDTLKFIYPEEFVRFENERGECLKIYSNIDRLEEEMLKHAPEEAKQIHQFASAVRRLTKFELPDPSAGFIGNWQAYLHDLSSLPLLRQLSRVSSSEYGQNFTNPLLRGFFGDGETAEISAIALFLLLAWMSERNAGYPIGGSQAVIQLIEQKLTALGGNLRFGAKVDKILVKHDAAVGVELADGEKVAADWVISAADGHATHYDFLRGKYLDESMEEVFRDFETFPSYLQVSFGIAQNLSQHPGFVTRLLDSPIEVDPATQLNQLSFRIFNFDPTFAPPGKTAVTCTLPTRNFEYWVDLQQRDPVGYHAEKERVAEAVIANLEKRIPNIRPSIEVIDVSTPATVIRYTGNWKGSMEGWLPTPTTGFRQLPNTVPGLRQFLMVGQWVMPGGGLPSGLMTARSAIQSMCKHDHIPFHRKPQPAMAPPVAPTARPTSASTAAH